MPKQLSSTCTDTEELSGFEKHLLNDFQHGFPLESRPFKTIARDLGVSEEQVIDTLQLLQQRGYISRVGAVFRPNTIGASTLAAMSVPEHRVVEIAEIINEYREVNHNYQRDHSFNLWFVLTAQDEKVLQSVICDIGQRTGFAVMSLPLLEDYHIDLGFELLWT